MRLDGSISTGAGGHVAKRTVLNSIDWSRQDPWILIRTAPGQEARVAEFVTLVLAQECYSPEVQCAVILNGQQEIVYRPVLSTYGFLRWSDLERPMQVETIQAHCKAFGAIVTRLSRGKLAGAKADEASELRAPVLVKNSDVVDLLIKSAAGGVVKATQSIISSLLGTTIVIPYGHLFGYEARVIRIKSEIVELVLDVFGRQQYIKFPRERLFPNLDFEA